MKKEEFIRTVQICGYGTKTGAKKYVELNPKEEYGTDDLIALHEGNMHWQGINGDKGLGYAYGVNGKTTAYSNGISGNSGGETGLGDVKQHDRIRKTRNHCRSKKVCNE